MEYSIRELAELAGVSARTLRWYHETGLLSPSRIGENGYRYYGGAEVDRLQQIMFYRELGVELSRIKDILDDPAFDRMEALRQHLRDLEIKEQELHTLITAVKEIIITEEKGEVMSDQKKFEAFKRQTVEENERRYGEESRRKYGDAAVDGSRKNVLGLSQEEYNSWTQLEQMILEKLAAAVEAGVPCTGEVGKEIAGLHRRWLSVSLKGSYDAAKHRGIAQLYVMDERFTAYYDARVSGCARFLCDAVQHWIR